MAYIVVAHIVMARRVSTHRPKGRIPHPPTLFRARATRQASALPVGLGVTRRPRRYPSASADRRPRPTPSSSALPVVLGFTRRPRLYPSASALPVGLGFTRRPRLTPSAQAGPVSLGQPSRRGCRFYDADGSGRINLKEFSNKLLHIEGLLITMAYELL